MLSPATGEGAKPRIGSSDGGVERSRGFAFDGLAFASFAESATAAVLEFLFESAAGDFFGIFSDEVACLSAGDVFSEGEACLSAGVCFCLSSASSDWMRFSIASIFFNRASLTSPSAAPAVPPPMIDIAVARSSVLCLERLSGRNLNEDEHRECSDMGPPICGGQELRDFVDTYYVTNHFGNSEKARPARGIPPH